MAATVYFCKQLCPGQNVTEVGSKSKTKQNPSKHQPQIPPSVPRPLCNVILPLAHPEMGFSFYSLNADLTMSVARPLQHSHGARQKAERCVCFGTCLSCWFWRPEVSMGRTWANLLEDEKHHEAETSHLPTTSRVLDRVHPRLSSPSQAASDYKPATPDRNQKG